MQNLFKNFLTVFALIISTIILIGGCQKTDTPPLLTSPSEDGNNLLFTKDNSQSSKVEYVPGEVIVKFNSGVSVTQRETVLKKVKATTTKKIRTRAMEKFGDKEGITVINTTLSVPEAIDELKQMPEVEYAEPNYIYHHCATSNDPYYTNGSLWGMYGDATTPANQFGSQAGEAWAAGNIGSTTVHIGIIDEGIMWSHEDLVGQIWVNPYDPVDGIDNDGNGYIDDTRGWDFANNDNTIYDGASDDHGTHVAGTIGAIGGNAKGVVGVCWNVKIISAKFLGTTGGTTTNAILAIDYLTDLKIRHGLNLPATNNSWGGGAFSQALQDAIERANQANILFIAAAGNNGSNNDLVPSYPASYPNANIIAVASITSTGTLSSFSNYGATSVDLGAPGSNIYSTVPSKNGKTSAYALYSGTSMATPHVTGGVALYAASHPGASAATIKSAILSSVIPTASLSGKCLTGGRLNVSGF